MQNHCQTVELHPDPVSPQAPAHRRLLGWIRHRIRSAPSAIWVRVDLDEFCAATGISLRAARYGLNTLRDDQEAHRLKIRTVWRHRAGRRGHWQVIASSTDQLLFDKEPLFRAENGKARHVRPHLRQNPIERAEQAHRIDQGERSAGGGCADSGGEKPPSESKPEGCGRAGTCHRVTESQNGRIDQGGRCECNRIRGRVFQTQQTASNTPGAGASNRLWRVGQRITPEGRRRLQRKAGAITRRLAGLWWDNCKVADPAGEKEARAGIFGFVWRALRDGHAEARITGALDVALHHLHGTATDRGEVFTVASTITRARAILERDNRGTAERAQTFYQNRMKERDAVWAEIRAENLIIP